MHTEMHWNEDIYKSPESKMTCSLDSILLSDTNNRESSSNPTMSLALRISLLILLRVRYPQTADGHNGSNPVSPQMRTFRCESPL